MHANTPYAGRPADETPALTPEQRRGLRRDLTAVTARTRELLPDAFAVGSEITAGVDGPTATVAVRPPVGSIVSAGFTPEEDFDDVASELAAGAVIEARRRTDDITPAAQ